LLGGAGRMLAEHLDGAGRWREQPDRQVQQRVPLEAPLTHRQRFGRREYSVCNRSAPGAFRIAC
jgi:hypothetical protein